MGPICNLSNNVKEMSLTIYQKKRKKFIKTSFVLPVFSAGNLFHFVPFSIREAPNAFAVLPMCENQNTLAKELTLCLLNCS